MTTPHDENSPAIIELRADMARYRQELQEALAVFERRNTYRVDPDSKLTADLRIIAMAGPMSVQIVREASGPLVDASPLG